MTTADAFIIESCGSQEWLTWKYISPSAAIKLKPSVYADESALALKNKENTMVIAAISTMNPGGRAIPKPTEMTDRQTPKTHPFEYVNLSSS